MPKGKSKDIVFAEAQECFNKYGVSNGDLMTCPMGVEIQIVGMGKGDLRLYAKFQGGVVSPVDALNRESLLQSGYKPMLFDQSTYVIL